MTVELGAGGTTVVFPGIDRTLNWPAAGGQPEIRWTLRCECARAIARLPVRAGPQRGHLGVGGRLPTAQRVSLRSVSPEPEGEPQRLPLHQPGAAGGYCRRSARRSCSRRANRRRRRPSPPPRTRRPCDAGDRHPVGHRPDVQTGDRSRPARRHPRAGGRRSQRPGRDGSSGVNLGHAASAATLTGPSALQRRGWRARGPSFALRPHDRPKCGRVSDDPSMRMVDLVEEQQRDPACADRLRWQMLLSGVPGTFAGTMADLQINAPA